MRGDVGYNRYYAYMSLFTTSMLGLVLASSILQLFVFWELVGLCSYLLIGFWFYKDSARKAATKAFMVTRIGDLGFMIALLHHLHRDRTRLTSSRSRKLRRGRSDRLDRRSPGSRSASSPARRASPRSSRCTSGCPTRWKARRPSPRSSTPRRWWPPVSTSSRDSSRSSSSPTTRCSPSPASARITAIIAALLGIVATDIKRVMAYSTISQLGYMMMGLGVGGIRRRDLPPVHARLLQGAALPRLRLREPRDRHVRHAEDGRPRQVHADHLRDDDSSRSLALVGVFPLAGFWSKDEILADAWDDKPVGLRVGTGRRLPDRALRRPHADPHLRRRIQGRRSDRPRCSAATDAEEHAPTTHQPASRTSRRR